MRTPRILLAVLVLLSVSMLQAQENCYETQRQKGIQLFNQGDYAAASKNFVAAKSCTDAPANNDLDAWIDKCVIVVRLSTRKLEFPAENAEEQCVEVSTNAKTIRVGAVPDWCTVTQQGKMLYVSCKENEEVAPREAKVSIYSGGKTAILEVVQRSADLEMVFDPETLEFSSQEETKTVLVSTNGKDWRIETAPSWLMAARQEDTLSVTSQKNASPHIRTGELSLSASGQLFSLPVRQLPGDTVVTVDLKELVFPEEGNAASLKVSCNVGGWQAETSDPWIELRPVGDSVRVAGKENPSVFSRHGVVRIRCGSRFEEVKVHQAAHVSDFTLPASELENNTGSDREQINVTSVPSNLRVYVDDSIIRYTPFSYLVDYEHHSLLVGFERREFLFNEKQPDIEFRPGLRFASITFGKSKHYGLMTGFVSANAFGAYSHFRMTTPLVKEFGTDHFDWKGYHFTVGPVYRPIPYLGMYLGLGMGVYQGEYPAYSFFPRFGLDYELGLMGFFKNLMVSVGWTASRLETGQQRNAVQVGVGGYLKRYYDKRFGYCSSDSRRWWSLNYMMRPALGGKGVMFGDLGKEKLRTYLKAMYLQQKDGASEDIRNIDASLGLLITPVNGVIDVCMGAGAEMNLQGLGNRFLGVGVEAGVIMNFWRFPVTFMLHESDLLNHRKLYMDFGIGFHLGEFKRFSYK